jgi:hypothetical protein
VTSVYHSGNVSDVGTCEEDHRRAPACVFKRSMTAR